MNYFLQQAQRKPAGSCSSVPLLDVMLSTWKGKKSAWLTWDVCEKVSESFTRLSHCPSGVSDGDMQKLETFAVLMYDRSRASSGVDEASLDLFA